MIEVLYVFAGLLIFGLGVLTGYVLRNAFTRYAGYDGVIRIVQEEDRKLFLLELDGDPSDLEFEDRVVFRVLSSG